MLQILFQDDYFVAIDKPSGLLVHRNSWCPKEAACLELLRDQIGRFIYSVHRIDRATSGVLVFALEPTAAARLSEEFRFRRVYKSYLAVARGYLEAAGRFDDPLQREDGKGSQTAVTDFRREATVELHAAVGPYPTARYSLVRLTPHTGRRHQLRRHLSHASHPIVGDTKHGDRDHNAFFRSQLGVQRLLLMATDLRFTHPYTGALVHLHAPIPAEVESLFGRLGWPTERHHSGDQAEGANGSLDGLRARGRIASRKVSERGLPECRNLPHA